MSTVLGLQVGVLLLLLVGRPTADLQLKQASISYRCLV